MMPDGTSLPTWLIFFFLWLFTKEEIDWQYIQPDDPRCNDAGDWIIEADEFDY